MSVTTFIDFYFFLAVAFVSLGITTIFSVGYWFGFGCTSSRFFLFFGDERRARACQIIGNATRDGGGDILRVILACGPGPQKFASAKREENGTMYRTNRVRDDPHPATCFGRLLG